MNLTSWIWLSAVIIFGCIEVSTAGLVCVWFEFGCVAALITSLLGGSVLLQLVLFFAVSTLALLLTRPLANMISKGKVVPTNLDRVVGTVAKVTEAIDNENQTGAVYAEGKTWTARSENGRRIPVGARVTVARMDGVKLFVTYCEEKKETT